MEVVQCTMCTSWYVVYRSWDGFFVIAPVIAPVNETYVSESFDGRIGV